SSVLPSISRRGRQGQQQPELGMAGAAVAIDRAAVLLNEGLCQGETEPGAAVPARDQRMKNALANRLRDARTVVYDLQYQHQRMALSRQSHLARYAGAENDLCVPCATSLDERLGSIARDVQYGLN